jgi:hypothetical protein
VLNANYRPTGTSADSTCAQISILSRSGLQTTLRDGTGEATSGHASPAPYPLPSSDLSSPRDRTRLTSTSLPRGSCLWLPITGGRWDLGGGALTDRLRLLLWLPHGSESSATGTAGYTFSAENTGARHRRPPSGKAEVNLLPSNNCSRRLQLGGWFRSWHTSSTARPDQIRRYSKR